MTCADFEASFDQYVDDTLDTEMAEACSCHIAKCRPCDREVTRWQQTRILLSTAVADFATAVDVSSVRNDVFAALGFDQAAGVGQRAGTMREAAHQRSVSADRGFSADRSGDARRSDGRGARREAASAARRQGFRGFVRFASAATVSAVAAAAAVMVLTPGPATTTPTGYAKAPSSSSASVKRVNYVLPWSKDAFNEAAAVANTPPPLARPNVSHVDGLEAAPGQLVSTWVQPRTNARVIWVEDRGLGAPIRMAGLGK